MGASRSGLENKKKCGLGFGLDALTSKTKKLGTLASIKSGFGHGLEDHWKKAIVTYHRPIQRCHRRPPTTYRFASMAPTGPL